jgi:poly(3-hydroxybutyrate) depolymerase
MDCSNVVAKSTDTLPADGNSVEVRVDKAKYERCENNVDVEQWKLNGVDHFMERETSDALFNDVVTWLNDLD